MAVAQQLRYFLDNETSDLLGRLKEGRDRDNVAAHLNHLLVYYYLRQHGVPCVWEPKVGVKETDLAITLPDRRMVYLEVLTILDSAADRARSKEIEKLQIRVNKLPSHPYGIMLQLERFLSPQDSDLLYKVIAEKITSGKLRSSPREKTEQNVVDERGAPIATVSFIRGEGASDGGWLAHGGPAHSRRDSFRVKKKILDKIEEGRFQLPIHPELGGLVIVIDDTWTDVRDVVDALAGSEAVTFSMSAPPRPTRQSDGVVHHMKGGNLAHVQFVVAIARPREPWTRENVRIIPQKDGLILPTDIESIFLDANVPVLHEASHLSKK